MTGTHLYRADDVAYCVVGWHEPDKGKPRIVVRVLTTEQQVTISLHPEVATRLAEDINAMIKRMEGNK